MEKECKYEKFVRKYYGLSENSDEWKDINYADFCDQVNMLAMFDNELCEGIEIPDEQSNCIKPAVIKSVCPDCLEGRDPFEPDWKCPRCRRQTVL